MRPARKDEAVAPALQDHDARALLAAIIDSSDDAIVAKSPDGTIRSWNRGAEVIYGYAAEEMVGKSIGVLIPPDRAGEMDVILRRIREGERVDHYETSRVRKDGETIFVSLTVSPVLDAAGTLVAVSSIARDITARKRVEEEARRAAQSARNLALEEDVSARRRSEQMLRESEARYRALFEKSPLPKWLYDAKTLRFLTVNDVAVREYGYSREEFLKMTIKDIRPAEDVAALIRELESTAGSTSFAAVRHTRKDGTIIDVEITAHTFLLEGRMTRVVVAQDVTERRRAQQALEASERRMALFFRLTRVGLMMTRLRDRKILDANDTFLEQVGWKREEVIGRTTIELGLYAHPEDVERIYEGVRSPERIGSREAIIRRKNGDEGIFLITGASTDIAGERCLIGAWHDITGLRRADAARQQSDERLRQIAEAAREVFWLADGVEHKILYVSPAYETIWGRSCESLYRTPRSWMDAIHPADRPRVLEAEGRQLSGAYDVEYRILRPDGSLRWIRDRATPLRDADGKVVRVTGVAEDITHRRELEDRLRQAQKLEAIGSLAGGIAHDFNNILSVILTYSEMMLGGLRTGDPMHADLQEIKEAGRRAADLTRQLLAFSRRQILQPRVVDLNLILAGMEKMLRRLIGEDIELAVIPSGSAARVNVDPGQMEQVIMNLAVNARDAMPDGGKLTIEIDVKGLGETCASRHGAPPGPHVLLAVTDTGVGMDAATQAHIFEPFFTTKEQGKGTGLGLSMVFGIVRQSGGSIWLRSEPAHGTSFEVYLPEVAPEVPEQERKPQPAALPGSETILLVEDEEMVRKVARVILERSGYRVLEAHSGGDALVICEENPGVDLLLTDVVMPRMSGAQLATRLCQARPDLKVLFMSGYTDDTVVLHGVLHAQVAFLQKPFTPEALLSRVRETLDSSRAPGRGDDPLAQLRDKP